MPVIRAAQRAGHEVEVAAPPSLHDEVVGDGLEHIVVGSDWYSELARELAREETPRQGSASLQQVRDAFPLALAYSAGEPAEQAARDIVAAVRSRSPDVIVRESEALGGALAAEELGIPSAVVGTLSSDPESFAPERLVEILSASRRALALPDDPEGGSGYGALYASLMPAEFDGQVSRIPNVRHYQDDDLASGGGQLPAWLTDVPDNGPFIYGCLSSVALSFPPVTPHGIQMMRALIAALGEIKCTALVSVGPWVDPHELGQPAPHVHLTDHVSQKLALACADLFVTHAGYSSVRESVRAGTPMVMLPLLGDTIYTAARAAEYGIAENLPSVLVTKDEIRDACVHVLYDRRYGRSIKRLQRQMLSLPSLDTFIADLEQVTRDTQALRAGASVLR